ncbi:MAG: hypothetical protein J6W76_01250 [Spirochaetales bacterium]|nr:hypothetical protein [Spirochaetales bacterium]
MKKHKLIVIIGTIVLMSFFGCDTESGQSPQNNSSDDKPTIETTGYKIEDVVLDSVAYTLTVKTDAPDGTEFSVELNNMTVTAKVYQQKLEFNVAPCFDPMHDLGGIDYTVKFRSANADITPSEKAVGYWPMFRGEIQCDEVMMIWNGCTDKIQMPLWYVNYAENTFEVQGWVGIYDNEGHEIDEDSCEEWTFDDVKEYLSKTENIDTSVCMFFKVTPVCNGVLQTDIAAEFGVEYKCCKNVLVESALIERSYDQYKVACYDASGDIAGGNIQYEWQIADSADAPNNSWKKINETMPTHSVTQNEVGKYLRVILTQNYNDETQDVVITPPKLVKNFLKTTEVKLKYNNVLPVGNVPSTNDISISAVNIFGEKVDGMTLSLSDDDYTTNGLPYSDYVNVTVSKDNYEDMSSDVFITVQNVVTDEDMPQLSQDVSNISLGKIKFGIVNSLIECSLDGGLVWEDMTSDEFIAVAGSTILVRKKSVGQPNVSGYLMESEPRSSTVTESDIGKKTSMSGINIDVKNVSLSLTTQTADNGDILVTANTENYNIMEEYIPRNRYLWKIDEVPVDSLSYADASGDMLTLHKSGLITGETYQVSVTLIVDSDYWTEFYGEESILLILSAHKSVKVQ